MIKIPFSLLSVMTLISLFGCATEPLTTVKEPMALEVALSRARFELNCPAATAAVLSKQTIQAPAARGVRVGGIDRAQFTIGVSGCDKRMTLVVLCADQGDSCFAGGGGER